MKLLVKSILLCSVPALSNALPALVGPAFDALDPTRSGSSIPSEFSGDLSKGLSSSGPLAATFDIDDREQQPLTLSWEEYLARMRGRVKPVVQDSEVEFMPSLPPEAMSEAPRRLSWEDYRAQQLEQLLAKQQSRQEGLADDGESFDIGQFFDEHVPYNNALGPTGSIDSSLLSDEDDVAFGDADAPNPVFPDEENDPIRSSFDGSREPQQPDAFDWQVGNNNLMDDSQWNADPDLSDEEDW